MRPARTSRSTAAYTCIDGLRGTACAKASGKLTWPLYAVQPDLMWIPRSGCRAARWASVIGIVARRRTIRVVSHGVCQASPAWADAPWRHWRNWSRCRRTFSCHERKVIVTPSAVRIRIIAAGPTNASDRSWGSLSSSCSRVGGPATGRTSARWNRVDGKSAGSSLGSTRAPGAAAATDSTRSTTAATVVAQAIRELM